jgi:HEAT repeat protein
MIGDKRAVEPLIHVLKDKDEDVRMNAADALGTIGDKMAVKPLLNALKEEDHYFEVQESIAKALCLL